MKPFTIIDVDQRSQVWHLARLGRLTGSCAEDMLTAARSGGEAAGRRNLRVRLVLERLTGRPQESDFSSRAMDNGSTREPEAFALYEALTGTMLARTGFLSHDEYMAGCSLDGHVGDFDGIAEIKCPIAATHWDYVRSGKVPGGYLKQVTHNLWITGAQWCDWFSFHPDFPEALRMKVVRVERSSVDIGEYEKKALAFLREVDLEVAAARGLSVLEAV